MKTTFIPEILTKLGTDALQEDGKYTSAVCHSCEHSIIYQNSFDNKRCKICIVTEKGIL